MSLARRVAAVAAMGLLVLGAPGAAWAHHGKGSHSPTPSPPPTAPASPTPTPSPTPTQTPEPDPSPSKSPLSSQPKISIETRADGLLTEVGDAIGFVVKVTNMGPDTLEDVVVVDLVPAEIDVEAVDLVDGVDAVQLGQHQGQADIVWVLAPLAPKASVELTWTGRVARRGDLLALNTAEARVDEDPVELSRFTTYLAGEAAMGVSNPPYRRVDRRVVVRRVPAPAVLGSVALPATGAPLRDVALAGLGLVVVGLSLLGAARFTRRGLSAGLVALFLVVAGCTGSEPEVARPSSSGPSESPQASPPKKEKGDRVRGVRVERERGRDADTTATAEVPATPPQRFEIVREVRRVVVHASDLPARSLGSRPGDNVLSYVFDADAERIVEAHSSRFVVAGADVEVLSGVALEQGTLETTGTVRNLSPRTSLRVHGRIVLEIHREGGGVALLRSDEIDVTLAPHGEVATPFSHLLPSGEYRVEASFQASP